MPAKTPPEPPRARSGKVHEAQRHTVRVRVPKEPVEALAKRWGCDETEAVVRAVREAASDA